MGSTKDRIIETGIVLKRKYLDEYTVRIANHKSENGEDDVMKNSNTCSKNRNILRGKLGKRRLTWTEHTWKRDTTLNAVIKEDPTRKR